MKFRETYGLGKQSYKNFKENLNVFEQFAEFCNIPNKKKNKINPNFPVWRTLYFMFKLSLNLKQPTASEEGRNRGLKK